MNILIAPNAFKHGLSSKEVALAIKEGFLQSRLKCHCECFPVGDGGDGTGDLIIKRAKGNYVHATVKNALGRDIDSTFGLIDNGKTAVIELANASGLRLMQRDELNPLKATSYGTGQQIKMALDKGVNKIIIAIGGSATVDGACGILQALGARFLDGNKNEIINLPEGLLQLDSIDLSLFDKRVLNAEIIVLCDVDNKLLGEHGAASVFGPQKGASAADVQVLDAALQNYADVIFKHTGIEVKNIVYGGAAGGVAAGLYAYLDAALISGINYFLHITGFKQSLEKADVVITGEGSIDEQTLQGKAPFGVASQAKELGLPVIALAGRAPLIISSSLQKYFDIVLPIGNEPTDLSTALKRTANNLRRTACAAGNMLSL